ncbi:MAG: type II secretion system protein GspM [Polynucleobacter sp.]|nr:type II secretion system protein GspM [Polynucleobacter sp.]MDP3135006.1 type II secretion system protein GspM [Burkholderiaceae bacterium]
MSRLATLRSRWAALAPRERALSAAAAALIALALIWWLAIAGALQTLRQAESQHASLDAQLGRMRALQAQALALQSQPRMTGEESRRILEELVRQRLGQSAQINAAGDRITVTLRATPADALALWLTQVRVNARAHPVEARITRTGSGATWDGTVVLTLPAR